MKEYVDINEVRDLIEHELGMAPDIDEHTIAMNYCQKMNYAVMKESNYEKLLKAAASGKAGDTEHRAKWVSDGYTWRCSECGKTYWGRLAKPWNYCPNCGAKVKEEKGEI